MKPMLLVEESLSNIDRLCVSSLNWMEPKVDGARKLVGIGNGGIVAWGRSGQDTEPPAISPAAIRQLSKIGDFVFDGEWLDGTYWVFDLVELRSLERTGASIHPGAQINAQFPYRLRRQALEMVLGELDLKGMALVPVFREAKEQRRQIEALVAMNAEGVVFKDVESRYEFGRKSRHWTKVKFTNDLDAVVTAIAVDGKENVEVGLFNGRSMIPVATCSTHGKDVPNIGDVVVVRYLYALHPEMPRLYGPPRIVGVRNDKPASECLLDQVQYTTKKVLV